MRRIILAGGIGAGKSVVARSLRLMGYGVYDCDSEARRLMHESEEIRRVLVEVGGNDIFDASGVIDRKRLAAIIFADSDKRKLVNTAVHQAVRDDIIRWCGQSERNIFIETAIASESGLAKMADEVWLVDAPVDERIERVETRDSRSREEIMKIIQAQRLEEDMLRKEGVRLRVISNGKEDALLSELEELVGTLYRRA